VILCKLLGHLQGLEVSYLVICGDLQYSGKPVHLYISVSACFTWIIATDLILILAVCFLLQLLNVKHAAARHGIQHHCIAIVYYAVYYMDCGSAGV